MAEEDNGQEKTEEPSAKRQKESREKGQIARSKDFNALVILSGTGIGFLLCGKEASKQLLMMMRAAFDFEPALFITQGLIFQKVFSLAQYGFYALIPLLGLIFLLSLAAPLLLGGWVFSAKAFAPKFSRLNPLKGLQRMVSFKGFMEMLKSFLKFVLISCVALLVLKIEVPALLGLAHLPLESAIREGLFILLVSFLIITASLILIALIDVPFQLFEHNKQLKMTKQEIKDEYKETEGKPELKGHIRRTQQDIARRRMMSEIPIASVVLTNPTHYAVAIRYDKDGNKPPIVVAKGKDLIALQINKVALANAVPILSLPPLARAVYFSTKLNAEIPRGLYVAVAQVLAYIYQLDDKKRYEKSPGVLQNVPIPDELARDAEEIV